MKFPGKEIAQTLQLELKKQVELLSKQGKTPHLVDILIGESPEQISFVKIKERVAKEIGIEFTFHNLKKTPSFEELARILKTYSADPKVDGIIVQQPLPNLLQTDSIYNFIPLQKEIEGHKPKSPFAAPLGLAVLTALKYYLGKQEISSDLFVDLKNDLDFFKKNLRGKRIILVGRGITGGRPVGETLNKIKLDYWSMNSRTQNPSDYFKNADILISAVGDKIISPEMLKPGVILLNIGLRHEDNKLKGDYDEEEVASIASMYTPTPGGIGPLDVTYLFKNLIDAVSTHE